MFDTINWIIYIGVWAIFWGILTEVLSVRKGFGRSGFWIGAILGLLGFLIVVCSKPKNQEDKSTNKTSTAGTASSTTSVSDDLVKLKELYDSGILTQEEFEEKRKTLVDKL